MEKTEILHASSPPTNCSIFLQIFLRHKTTHIFFFKEILRSTQITVCMYTYKTWLRKRWMWNVRILKIFFGGVHPKKSAGHITYVSSLLSFLWINKMLWNSHFSEFLNYQHIWNFDKKAKPAFIVCYKNNKQGHNTWLSIQILLNILSTKIF